RVSIGKADHEYRKSEKPSARHGISSRLHPSGHAPRRLFRLEAADIVDDPFDLSVVQRALEGRHGAFLAILDAVGDETVAALGAGELGAFAGGAAAIGVTPAAGGGEEALDVLVAHLAGLGLG